MSSRLRKCDATRQHATAMPNNDVASPWQQQKAARDPLVAGELEPHSKGAGRITQSQAWRARLNPRQTDASSGINLQSKGKARAAATTKERKGNYAGCAFKEAAITVARGKYSILRQYLRGGTYRSRHVRTGRVVFGGFAKSLQEDDVVERALRAQELLEHFFVVNRVAYDVLDGTVAEGPRLVTDNGPATVAQPRSVGEARLVVHS